MAMFELSVEARLGNVCTPTQVLALLRLMPKEPALNASVATIGIAVIPAVPDVALPNNVCVATLAS